MPIVRIEMFPGRTREQKAAAALAVTEALTKTIKCTPESTSIVFVDVEKSDWATAGKLADER